MIKLVTRIQLTDTEELEMEVSGQLPAKLQGYLSGIEHPEPPAVGIFLQKHNLPWEPGFVPVFVYGELDEPEPPGSALGAFGWPFLLRNNTVLPDLQLVCCNDIQNAVKNGPSVSDFWDLRNLNPQQIEGGWPGLNGRKILRVPHLSRRATGGAFEFPATFFIYEN